MTIYGPTKGIIEGLFSTARRHDGRPRRLKAPHLFAHHPDVDIGLALVDQWIAFKIGSRSPRAGISPVFRRAWRNVSAAFSSSFDDVEVMDRTTDEMVRESSAWLGHYGVQEAVDGAFSSFKRVKTFSDIEQMICSCEAANYCAAAVLQPRGERESLSYRGYGNHAIGIFVGEGEEGHCSLYDPYVGYFEFDLKEKFFRWLSTSYTDLLWFFYKSHKFRLLPYRRIPSARVAPGRVAEQALVAVGIPLWDDDFPVAQVANPNHR